MCFSMFIYSFLSIPNIYYLVKPMQIYGILLNICGILLNIRGKTEKYGEFHGILWIFHGKCVENHSFLFHFFPFHSSTSCRMTRFRGRFRSFLRSFSEKIGEFRRKMENIGEIIPFHSFSFHFIPLSFLFIPQTLDFLPQMLNLTGYNKKVIFLFGRT